MSITRSAYADVNLEARAVLVTLGGRAPVALTMPAARDLLNSLTAAIAAQDARDAENDDDRRDADADLADRADRNAERTECGCMPEDPRDGGPERVVTHSATCSLSPLHADFLA